MMKSSQGKARQTCWQQMKCCHFAALALVGWYLMAPPTGVDNEIQIDSPLCLWDVIGSYDNAEQCHAGKVRMEQGLNNPEIEAGMHPVMRIWLKMKINQSHCVASDDPRLKGAE
jgi:hypothetical protein